MRQILLILTTLLIATTILAQSPQTFKYQSVIRDNAGEILANQLVSIRLSIHNGTSTGTIVYQETHSLTTNQFGLVNLEVGNGNTTIGSFVLINWGAGSKYLEIELDPNGLTSYVSLGTSKLMSVPYALYAKTSENDVWAANGSDIYFNDGDVGIGIINPDNKMHIHKGSAGSVTAHGESALVIENNSTVALSILTPSTYEGVIYFGDNSSNIAGGIVYNHPNDALTFRTGNNIEQLRITAGGDVGIGKTNPSYKLDISGTTQMTGFRMPTGVVAGHVLTSDGSGVGTWQSSSGGDISAVIAGTGLNGGGISGDVTLNIEAPLSLSAISYDGIIVGTNNGEGFGVHGINITSGNYGVLGTADGTYQNDGVYGYAPTGYGVHGQSGNGTGIFGESTNGTGVYGVNLNTYNYGELGTSNYGVYGYASTGHAGYFDGDVSTSGFIGIGIPNPTRSLHIYGLANPRILIESPSDQAPEINLKRGSITHSLYINSNSDLVFYQAGDRVTFKGNGNVGIGTTDPGGKLHIRNSLSNWGMLRLENANPGQNEVSIAFREGSDVSGENIWLTGVGLYGKDGKFIIGRDGERFIIDQDGNIGIGVSSISDKSSLFTNTKKGNSGKALGHKLTVGNTSDDNVMRLVGPDGSYGYGARLNFGDSDYAYIEEDEDDRLYLYSNRTAIMGGYVGIGTTDPTSQLTVRGNVLIESNYSGLPVVELGEGLDYAEGFDIADEIFMEPGTVLSIDSDNPGELTESVSPYDTKVAGIVAGANNLGSGVKLGSGQFDCNVALAGRVYCNVDANYGKISPGDLLTTSPTPGYAMIVKNNIKAQGAILGKAMESLAKGEKGQILVLVTLQ